MCLSGRSFRKDGLPTVVVAWKKTSPERQPTTDIVIQAPFSNKYKSIKRQEQQHLGTAAFCHC